MAVITKNTQISDGKSAFDATKAEQIFVIDKTESGITYQFLLKRQHLEVKPLLQSAIDPKKDYDWDKNLTAKEKTQLFAIIMDEYRHRSLGDNGFRGASIGVVAKPENAESETTLELKLEKGQSRLFIATNTSRWASPYFKDCAEQNMVNTATSALAFEQGSEALKGGDIALKGMRLNAIYIMQGINEKRIPMACSCGKCTDMLANVMESKDSLESVIPLLTDSLREGLLSGTAEIELNNKANTLADIKEPNEGNRLVSWHVPLSHVDRDRTLALDGKTAKFQREEYGNLLAYASDPINLPENIARSNLDVLHAHVSAGKEKNLIDQLADGLTKFLHNDLKLPFFSAAAHAAQNAVLYRHSEATLDTAVIKDGSVDITKINQFLVGKIRDALIDRLQSKPEIVGKTPAEKMAWAKGKDKDGHYNISFIRCVAIQMDDGTFHYSLETESKIDNAMPHAEMAALENAVSAIGRYGVRHAWVMEMNPADILEGKVMRTSPKEGLERLSKRQSTNGLDITYLPFNNASADIGQLPIKKYQIDEILPGAHRGHLERAKDKSKAKEEPKIWSNRELFLPPIVASRG